MRKLVLVSIALLSLSASSFAAVCESEMGRFESFYNHYSNISVPEAVDTMTSADKALNLAKSISEIATQGPVLSGLGDLFIREAQNMESLSKYRADGVSALLMQQGEQALKLNYCLESNFYSRCVDSATKFFDFDVVHFRKAYSIQISALKLAGKLLALGEKLNKLSASGVAAQMADFLPVIEDSKQLGLMRDPFLEQTRNDRILRNEVVRTVKACLNSAN